MPFNILEFLILGVKKPFVDKKGNKDERDRFVSPQPLMFGENHYNLRKFMQLPRTPILDYFEKLKKAAFCNVEFLVAKMKATSFEYETFSFCQRFGRD